MNVKRLFGIAVIFSVLIAPLRSQQAQAADYTLDDSVGSIDLYPGSGYRSYVAPKYVVQSLEELEQRVGQLPAGTKLAWRPYRRDASGKPILFSDGQYDHFAKFCRDHKIELLISPSPASGQVSNSDAAQERAQHPLLVVRERLHGPFASNCPVGKVAYGISYSVISVFADGRGSETVWFVTPCSDATGMSEWTAPTNAKTNDFELSADALAKLRSFLDRSEVKSLRDFLNAGGGVGDYDIEIHRLSGVQRIPIVSLMPEHDELKRDPALLQVICKAKGLAGDKRPPWCPN
jgi:hypothetical protein